MTTFLNVVQIDQNNKVIVVTQGEFEETPNDPNTIVVDDNSSIEVGDTYNADGTFSTTGNNGKLYLAGGLLQAMTKTERTAFYQAAQTDISINAFLDYAKSTFVNFNEQDNKDSIAELVTENVLTQARADEIALR